MSVQITGGSADQQGLIRQAHTQAISLATAAQAAAQAGGATFTLWFGAGSTSTVAANFGQILAALNSYAWTYDLGTMTDSPVVESVFVSPKTVDATAGAVTSIIWKGLFMQATTAAAQRMAALSIVHVCAEVREGWSNMIFVETAADAQCYATLDPAGAATSPRNYMEYAGAVTP
ncbi:MAG TPA: hypothetical protein VNW53_03165 [Phenylobacterium sp.]|jgi:hypothetical protein|uniref:hypothetical protein n=1 Tax=Phenylobacterium sp. TaxID=1871053 RepID=UPI002CC1FA42|nr:hypothetical protein [Phenylobacterium sp.]HXA37974.1 hypothetical protein [Phenylobacterium sp.]